MKKILLVLLILFNYFISAAYCAAGDTYESADAVVKSVSFVNDSEGTSKDTDIKQRVTVKIVSGKFKNTVQTIDNMLTKNPIYDILLSQGDKIILNIEPKEDIVMTSDDVNFYIAEIKRNHIITYFSAAFVLLLVIIAGFKGFMSFLSILLTVLLVFILMVPMILNGCPPLLAAFIICILSTFITMYLVGGVNSKSTSAIISTIISLMFASALSLLSIKLAHLTGFSGEETMFLYGDRPDLNFTGILSACMIIAALGALMDVAMSISSTINELHLANKKLTIKELFRSGMNVGKDAIGTMSNTLILVYLGSSMPLILLSDSIDAGKFFNLNQVATEILSALTGSMALLICVPVTAIISAYFIKKIKSKKRFFVKMSAKFKEFKKH